jgi:TolB-like protein
MKNLLKSFACLALFASFAQAASFEYVAVFETLADADSVLTTAEQRYLTNELRKQAVETLPTGRYSVLTRENLFALLPPGKDAVECLKGECLVDIGRNVGAEYAVQGTVSKFGSRLTFTVEAYDTKSGVLLGSFTTESPNADGLLDAIRAQAPTLFGKISAKNAPLVQDTALFVQIPVADTMTVDSVVVDSMAALADMALPAPRTIENTYYDDASDFERYASIAPEVPEEPKAPKPPTPTWAKVVVFSLDGLGLLALGAGLYLDRDLGVELDKYNNMKRDPKNRRSPFDAQWRKVEHRETLRNRYYIAGAALLASGLIFHITF